MILCQRKQEPNKATLDLVVVDFHLGCFGGRLVRSLRLFHRSSRSGLSVVLGYLRCTQGKLVLPPRQRRSVCAGT